MRRLVAALPLVLALAACGGSPAPTPVAPPRVPRSLAQTWAAQADAIAAAEASGDQCQAAQLAATLRGEVQGDAAQVPTSLRAPLVAAVDDLAARLPCTLPPVTTQPATPQPAGPPGPPPGPPGDHGKGHGGGRGNGGGGDG